MSLQVVLVYLSNLNIVVESILSCVLVGHMTMTCLQAIPVPELPKPPMDALLL